MFTIVTDDNKETTVEQLDDIEGIEYKNGKFIKLKSDDPRRVVEPPPPLPTPTPIVTFQNMGCLFPSKNKIILSHHPYCSSDGIVMFLKYDSIYKLPIYTVMFDVNFENCGIECLTSIRDAFRVEVDSQGNEIRVWMKGMQNRSPDLTVCGWKIPEV